MPGKESQGTAANQGGAFWQAPFVPSIMVGWMHTLTDRQLFLDPPQGEGDSEDEHFGQLPSEIKGAGLDMENEIRRHRQAMKRLGSRMQPFFVSDEAMAVYKLLMTGELPDDIEAVLQGKAPQTGRSKEEREGGKEGEEDVEKGNEQAAASKPSTSSQTRVTSLKAAMAVLCAFPERTCVIRSEIDEEEIEEPLHNRGGGGGSWCPWWRWNGKEAKDKQASGGQAAAVVKKGTPVFTVPGVYISIDSILGPMKMRPLFLKHSLLYDMLDAAERLLIKAAMVRRRTAREDTRRKILTVLSLVTGTHGASAGPPEESEDAGEEEDDGGMDPPEVNEFLAEMGEGGSSGNRGARPPQGPLGVVSTIAFGTIAVALSTVGALQDLADQVMFSNPLCRHLIGQQLEFEIKSETLEEAVVEVIEYNRARVPALPSEGTTDILPAEEDTAPGPSPISRLLDNLMTQGKGLDMLQSGKDVSQHFVDQLKRNYELAQSRHRRMMAVLRRLEFGGYTNADADLLAAVLSLAATVSSSPVFLDLIDNLGGWSFMKSFGVSTHGGSDSGSSSPGSKALPSNDDAVVGGDGKAAEHIGRSGPKSGQVIDGVLEVTAERQGDMLRVTLSNKSGDQADTVKGQGLADGSGAEEQLRGRRSSITIEVDLSEACAGSEDSDEDSAEAAKGAPLSAAAVWGTPKEDELHGFLLVGDLLPLASLDDANGVGFGGVFRSPPVHIGNIGDTAQIRCCDFPPAKHMDAKKGSNK